MFGRKNAHCQHGSGAQGEQGKSTVTHKLPSSTSFPVKARSVLGRVLKHLPVAQICNLWCTQELRFGVEGVMVPREAGKNTYNRILAWFRLYLT